MKDILNNRNLFLALATAITTAFIGLFAEEYFNDILCNNVTFFCGNKTSTSISPDELGSLVAKSLKYIILIFWFVFVFAIWASIWLKSLEDVSKTLRGYLDNEKKINSLYSNGNRLYIDKNEITLIGNPIGEPAIDPPLNPNGIFDVFITHKDSAFQDLFLCPTYFSYLVKRAKKLKELTNDEKEMQNNLCLYGEKIRLLVVDESDVVINGKEINPVFITYLSICDSLGYKTHIIKKTEYKTLCREFSKVIPNGRKSVFDILMSRPSLTYFGSGKVECDYLNNIEEQSIERIDDDEFVSLILAILCSIVKNDSANLVTSSMNHNIIIDAIKGSGAHNKRTVIMANKMLDAWKK